MTYESGLLETALATAAGDDFALFAELRLAFLQSASGHLDLMRRARCDANWTIAASRLHGVAVSFHDEELADLAREALAGAPNDPFMLRRIGLRLDKIGGQVGA